MTTIAAGTGFSGLRNEERDALAASLKRGEYNLFLGSGTSLDSKNKAGAPLPSGSQLRDDLCALVGISNTSTLQRAYGALTPDQVNTHVTNRFLDCEPGITVAKLPSFVWRRIFTLNIDDVLEAAYRIPGHLQNAHPYHFKDSFGEARTLEDVPIIHLHGRAVEPAKGYVFARSEYARVMAEANAWMTVLADIMPVEPFRHARHAVSIENHPFPLTTLGKVLLVQMGAPNHSATAAYSEAHSVLIHAIELERRHGRTSIHGYITLFKGTLSFFELGGALSEKQRDSLRELTAAAKHYFARDTELAEFAKELAGRL